MELTYRSDQSMDFCTLWLKWRELVPDWGLVDIATYLGGQIPKNQFWGGWIGKAKCTCYLNFYESNFMTFAVFDPSLLTLSMSEVFNNNDTIGCLSSCCSFSRCFIA